MRIISIVMWKKPTTKSQNKLKIESQENRKSDLVFHSSITIIRRRFFLIDSKNVSFEQWIKQRGISDYISNISAKAGKCVWILKPWQAGDTITDIKPQNEWKKHKSFRIKRQRFENWVIFFKKMTTLGVSMRFKHSVVCILNKRHNINFWQRYWNGKYYHLANYKWPLWQIYWMTFFEPVKMLKEICSKERNWFRYSRDRRSMTVQGANLPSISVLWPVLFETNK